MYYESHITIEPVFDKDLEEVKKIAEKHTFRVADLFMLKRPNDTPERSKYDTFMSAKNDDYSVLFGCMHDAIKELKLNGFKVWRYKIEHIKIDVRY